MRDARPGSTASGGEFNAHVLSLGLDGCALTLISPAFLSLVATRPLGACSLNFPAALCAHNTLVPPARQLLENVVDNLPPCEAIQLQLVSQ